MKNTQIQLLLISAVGLIIGSSISLGRFEGAGSELEARLGVDFTDVRSQVSVDFESSSKSSGTITVDRDGDVQLKLLLSGESAEFRRIDGEDYFNNLSDDAWSTYPQGADLIDTTLSTLELEGIASAEVVALEELGPDTCASGMCRIYRIARGESATTVRVDTITNRISELEGDVDGNTVIFIYNYIDESVDVQAPEEYVQTLEDEDTQALGR